MPACGACNAAKYHNGLVLLHGRRTAFRLTNRTRPRGNPGPRLCVDTVPKGHDRMSTNDRLPYIAFLMRKTSDPAISKDDQLEAVFDLIEAVDALIGDTTADPEDLWIACELQSLVASYARQHTGTAIAVLSEIAGSEDADPEDRAKARQMLKHAAQTLREQGTDISKWADPGTSRLQ